MKEKKIIAPNECSTGRWIATLIVGWLIGIVAALPLEPYLTNRENTIMGITYADFFGTLNFVPLFIGAALSLRLLAKTSLKDFILGVGGKINKKVCLTILGLYVLGFAIPTLCSMKYIHLRGVKADQYAFLLMFMILTTWLQTTWEELIFRGFAIRWACKNKVGFTKRAFIAGVISSLAFTLMHVPNPEVTSQKGINILIAVLVYMVPAVAIYVADLYFGNLLPGIIIHWVNNFLLFTLFSSDSNVVPVPTLFVDTTPTSPVTALVTTSVAYLPVMIYILIDYITKKKKAVASAQ